MEIPKEELDRMKKEALRRYPVSICFSEIEAPSDLEQFKRQAYYDGMKVEWLRAEDKMEAYKLKVEDVRKQTFDKLMEIETAQKEQQKELEEKDRLIAELRKQLSEANFPRN